MNWLTLVDLAKWLGDALEDDDPLANMRQVVETLDPKFSEENK